MNQSPARVAVAGLILILVPVAFGAAAAGPKARLFAKYDENKNGVIDGAEMAALRKDFAAEPKGDLARFDTDHDGKLSDEEIAQIKPPGKGGGKKGGGKKAESASADTKTKAEPAGAAAAPSETKPEAK
jgi:hypothetical protein